MGDIHMSTRRFVEHIKMGYEANQRYCFILGAGASRKSGIPTGKELMVEWRDYLRGKGITYIEECANDCDIKPEEWKPIFSDGYTFKSNDYFTLFDLRFAGMPVPAYKYLQDLMEKAEPSIGHYMLAALMENTENKLVITTNFDSLVEDVLYLYHAKHPLVVGHESLAPFISTAENVGRPVVAKVHRDLYFHPLNRAEELEKLPKTWEDSLRSALSKYIPIVIGYAGGDQTLMNLLKDMELSNIYWCALEEPEPHIVELLQKSDYGYLVKIDGFDEVMFALATGLINVKIFDERKNRMKELFEARLESYQTKWDELNEKVVQEATDRLSSENNPSKSSRDSGSHLTGRETPSIDMDDSAKNSLEFLSKMAGTDSSESTDVFTLKREALSFFIGGETEKALERLDQAISDKPDDPSLYHLKGLFLHRLGEYEKALENKTEAVRLEPDNARYHDSRGVTLHEMGRYEEALADKNEAVRLEPDNARYRRSRGVTLREMGRYDEALEDFNEAVRLTPNDAICYGSRGIDFHKLERYEEALADFNEAVRLAPNDPDNYENRSETLEKLGREEQAQADRETAQRLREGKN